MEEPAPVSTPESGSVSVKNGKVTWKFALKPNESKEINFSYELTKPSE